MNSVLLDSNLLIALLDPGDSLHFEAERVYSKISPSYDQIIPDVAANEALTVFARRSEERRQKTFASLLARFQNYFPKEKLVWLSPEIPRLYSQIIKMITDHDGRLNFHDCLIALWMRENNMEHIASFDADFDSISDITRISS